MEAHASCTTVTCKLTDNTLERSTGKKRRQTLLVSSDFSEGVGSWLSSAYLSVGFLHSSFGGCTFLAGLGRDLFASLTHGFGYGLGLWHFLLFNLILTEEKVRDYFSFVFSICNLNNLN